MPAFRRAVERGFGIELDVHIAADGELFVFHDETLRRMCGEDAGDVSVTSLTFDQLSQYRLLGGLEQIPRFSEVLDLINGRVPLIVELKCEQNVPPAPLCESVYGMLSQYRGAYCIESFNPYVVRWFRRNAPEIFRGQLAERFFTRQNVDNIKKRTRGEGIVRFVLEQLWLNVICRPDFVAFNCKDRDALSFRVWRRLLHMPAAGWTVRSRDELRALTAEGSYDCLIFEGFMPDENKIET